MHNKNITHCCGTWQQTTYILHADRCSYRHYNIWCNLQVCTADIASFWVALHAVDYQSLTPSMYHVRHDKEDAWNFSSGICKKPLMFIHVCWQPHSCTQLHHLVNRLTGLSECMPYKLPLPSSRQAVSAMTFKTSGQQRKRTFAIWGGHWNWVQRWSGKPFCKALSFT